MKDLLKVNHLEGGSVKKILYLAEKYRLSGFPRWKMKGETVALVSFGESLSSAHQAVVKMGAQPFQLKTRNGFAMRDLAKKLEMEMFDLIVGKGYDLSYNLAFNCGIPVINDTAVQGLQDMRTILNYKGRISGLSYCIVGNLTPDVKSFLRALSYFKPEKVTLYSDVYFYEEVGYEIEEGLDKDVDVAYVTGDKDIVFSKDTGILHPKPRTGKNSKLSRIGKGLYWRQLRNGVYCRAVILNYMAS